MRRRILVDYEDCWRHSCWFDASQLLVILIHSELVQFVNGLDRCDLIVLDRHFWQLALVRDFLSSLAAQPLHCALALRQQVGRSFFVEIFIHDEVCVLDVVCAQVVVVE